MTEDLPIMSGIFNGRQTYGIPLLSHEDYLATGPRWTRWTFYLTVALLTRYLENELERIGRW